MTRPVFSPELGAYFQSLREAKGWSQAKAVHKAAKLPNLSKNVLWRLERGKIKQPDRDVLMDVAALYDVPYGDIASSVAATVYQIRPEKVSEYVPLRQAVPVDSPSKSQTDTTGHHGSQNPSISTEERLRALEGGLQTILRIAFGLLGEKASVGVIDVATNSTRNDGARTESSRPSEGDRPVRARRVGARR